MSRALLAAAAALALLACGDDPVVAPAIDAGPTPDAAPPSFEECGAGDQAFVRTAILAGLGRHARSQGEVDVYTDLLAALRELDDPAIDPERVVVDAILRDPGYVDRWADHVMDALEVPRIEDQNQLSCYGRTLRGADDGALAAAVRDTPPSSQGDGQGAFTMLDLLRSSLVLDDLSPVYRAHLFALVSRPIPAANVPPVQAELARREDFGLLFDAAYLGRDLVCLGCHNSAQAVTDAPEPADDRHWPLPGHFEAALYGAHTGIAPERAHAPFRYRGFVANLFDGDPGETRPWGWSHRCGGFYPSGLEPDPAGVDGLFASLAGDSLTVYDLEAALGRGMDALAAGGLDIAEDGTIADRDAAFAYLVAAHIVDTVWREIVGSPLTIAHHFPRNQESRDLLHELTERFVASRFSLRSLIADVLTTPYVNRLDPAAGCGAGPYAMPPVYDPWTIADEDETRRANGSADGVAPLSGRTLLRATHEALGWTESFFQDFPTGSFSLQACSEFFGTCAAMKEACDGDGTCCHAHDYWCVYQPVPGEPDAGAVRRFLRGVGVFLKHGERGFRGLDFQARLVFEDRFGSCRKLRPEPDFLDAVQELAASTEGATLGDVVAAVKDRLGGAAAIASEVGGGGTSEAAAIEALFGAPLTTSAAEVADLDGRLRAFCGVLVSRPQFLLSGFAAPDGAGEPLLTPPAERYGAVCARVAARGLAGGLSARCDDAIAID